MKNRKIVQIFVVKNPNRFENNLTALCDDGTIWERYYSGGDEYKWTQIWIDDIETAEPVKSK